MFRISSPTWALLVVLANIGQGHVVGDACLDDFDDLAGISLLQKRASVRSRNVHVPLRGNDSLISRGALGEGGRSTAGRETNTLQDNWANLDEASASHTTRKHSTDSIAVFAERGHFSAKNSKHNMVSTVFWFVVAVLGVAVVLAACQHVEGGTHEVDIIRAKILTAQFLMQTGFSLIILDSFSLCAAMGMDATFSGFIVGVYCCGQAFGAFVIWACMAYYPTLWRSHGWGIVGFGVSCCTVGMCIYMVVASRVSSHNVSTRLPSLLVWSRIVGGFGLGSMQQLSVTTVARITVAPERPMKMLAMKQLGITANASGPLLAVLARSVNNTFTAVPWLGITMCCGLLAFLPWRSPSLTRVVDMIALDDYSETEPQHQRSKRVVIAGCLIMGVLRSSALGALEVGSMMLLQESFKWPLQRVGALVSSALLISIPVYAIIIMYKDQLSVPSFIRIMYTVSVLGSAFLFTTRIGGPWMLLLADALVYPTIYLAEALSLGIMQQNLLPTGSLFADTNMSMMWRLVFIVGVGKSVGPWLARWLIQNGGVTLYAYSQLVVLVVFALVFEIVVKPNSKDCQDPNKNACHAEEQSDGKHATKDFIPSDN